MSSFRGGFVKLYAGFAAAAHMDEGGGISMSFSELKQKDVINVCDGRRLGRPIDLILNERACVEAIVVPDSCGPFWFLRPVRDGLVIPWNRIRRIGDDVILVELDEKCAPGCG